MNKTKLLLATAIASLVFGVQGAMAGAARADCNIWASGATGSCQTGKYTFISGDQHRQGTQKEPYWASWDNGTCGKVYKINPRSRWG